MKQILIILLVTLSSLTATAQKQTYLLLAYGQKSINTVCGEKLMIQQDEVVLMPAEVYTYRSKLLTQIRATYNSKGFVAAASRTMKSVLNGTDYIPTTLMEFSIKFQIEYQEDS